MEFWWRSFQRWGFCSGNDELPLPNPLRSSIHSRGPEAVARALDHASGWMERRLLGRVGRR